MFKNVQLGRGFFRCWIVSSALWIAAVSSLFVWPHYAGQRLVPSEKAMQEVVQNRIDCLGYVDEQNTDKPWLHWKCASQPVDRDPLLDFRIVSDGLGTLTVELSDTKIVGVPDQTSSKEIAGKIHRYFVDSASATQIKTIQSDIGIVFGPPIAILMFGVAVAWVLRGFLKP